MRIFLLFSFLWVTPVLAQIETERSVSEVLTVTRVEDAKPFLLHKGIMEAIVQYSTELNFDVSIFNKRLNEKFSVYFETYKTRMLTEKLGKNFATELTPEQKETFLAGLESHRSEEWIKFSKLDQILDSYEFKTIESTPNNPSEWKAILALKLNRSKLEAFNSRLLSGKAKLYNKIQIFNEINLLGLSWPDLGLDKSSRFSEVLTTSWLKWFDSNRPVNVEEVTVCSGTCADEFYQWLQTPQNEGMQIAEKHSNTLWLKISFNLRRTSFSPDINEWQFDWDGSVVLLDANTKKIMSAYNLHAERKNWRGLDQKELNSALASFMYRAPLDAFTLSNKKIEQVQRLNRVSRLVIKGHSHLADVVLLMEMLRQEGKKLNFDVQLDLFSQKEAQLLCFYQGEEKSFTDLLSQVKELKSSHSYRLVNEFTGIHHVLKLIAE